MQVIGDYWAQPEGQRITFPHGTEERGETGKVKRWENRADSAGPVYDKMIAFITERPRTVDDIQKYLGVKSSTVRSLIDSSVYYTPDVWEEKAYRYSKTAYRFVGCVFIGRGDNYKLLEPEYEWRI